MTAIDLGRPVQGDVVELILDDHRRFETLLRDLRDSSSDRDAVRRAFAALHVAHAEAEEKHVYPKLRKKHAVGAHEAEHGEEEHAEGHEALLAVLELKGTDTQAFDDAVEELAKVVNHHLTEEELTILNPAREEVGPQVRAELGEQFATERNAQIDADCGTLTNVRKIVAAARKEGLLDDETRTTRTDPVDVDAMLRRTASPSRAPGRQPVGPRPPGDQGRPGGAGQDLRLPRRRRASASRAARPARSPTSGCDRYPDDATVMRYIGRSGWNDLAFAGAIPDDELLEAVDESYRLVVAQAARRSTAPTAGTTRATPSTGPRTRGGPRRG